MALQFPIGAACNELRCLATLEPTSRKHIAGNPVRNVSNIDVASGISGLSRPLQQIDQLVPFLTRMIMLRRFNPTHSRKCHITPPEETYVTIQRKHMSQSHTACQGSKSQYTLSYAVEDRQRLLGASCFRGIVCDLLDTRTHTLRHPSRSH